MSTITLKDGTILDLDALEGIGPDTQQNPPTIPIYFRSGRTLLVRPESGKRIRDAFQAEELAEKAHNKLETLQTHTAELEQRSEALEGNILELTHTIAQLETNKIELERGRDGVRADKERIIDVLHETMNKINELAQQVDDLEAKKKDLQQDVDYLEKEIREDTKIKEALLAEIADLSPGDDTAIWDASKLKEVVTAEVRSGNQPGEDF